MGVALPPTAVVFRPPKMGWKFRFVRVPVRASHSDECWQIASAALREKLDLGGQPYIEIEHEKKGRTHRHFVVSRTDIEHNRAIRADHNYRTHEEVARDLERQFGHERVQGAHVERDGKERPERTPSYAEMQQAKRTGMTPQEAKEFVTGLWHTTDSGKAFNAALEAHGWILARGDKRDFVLLDPQGEPHSLARRVDGAKAKDVRERMADLDPASLPNVQEAKAQQQALQAERENQPQPSIDLAAERAMQEARAAAKGRYDRLNETHRDVARDQVPGRYDDLRAAEPPPEVVREFASEANRTAEPAAPVYDRDADNAAWEAKLADNAIDAEAQKGRQQPGDSAWRETRGGGPEPSGGVQRPEAEDMRPLGKVAGEIRAAWRLSRSAEELEEALAVRGIGLAEVSAEEAQQSQRTAAFAKEVGNFGHVLREKEIVAVDQYGEVHRFDQRTTGDLRPEIEARLNGFAGIDHAGLLDVAGTKEVVQEAARAAWKDEQRIERDMARPLTGIETTIADALANTMTGTEFAEALDKAGITITRATAADIPALDALRDGADLAATVAFTSDTDIDRDARHYDTIAEGDYAAVTGSGDVFRLNPTALDFEEAEQRLADVQPRLPSVVEARAQNEISREKSAELWTESRAANAEDRAARNDAFEGDRALRDTVNAGERGVENTLRSADNAVNAGLDAASGAAGFLAKAFEKLLGFFGGGELKLTPQQARDQARADSNEETLHARAYAAAEQEKEAATDARIFELVRQQQQDKHREDMGLSDTPAAQRKARDDYDGGYERER